jgi:hypothetical protein
MPGTSSPKVLPVLANLITNRRISTTKAIFALKMASLTVNPDEELIRFLMVDI